MLTGFAAAAVPLGLAAALVPGVPAGAQATTTPAAATAWRNRLREIVTSRSISMPPAFAQRPTIAGGSRSTTGIGLAVVVRYTSYPGYRRTSFGHSRSSSSLVASRARIRRTRPLRFTSTSGFARRLRYHAGARSWPAFDATTTTAWPSGHPKTGAERGSPVRRPTVVISTTGPHAPREASAGATRYHRRWYAVHHRVVARRPTATQKRRRTA